MKRDRGSSTMQTLSAVLGAGAGDVVSVIGCGGKTSMLYRLAAENRALPVLMGTTTRMQAPPVAAYDRRWQPGMRPLPGITLAVEEIAGGKVRGIDLGILTTLLPRQGLAVLESDGSKMLPLKGWAAWEPVIVPETTLTVGVCTLWPVGHIIDEELVHRLPLFCAITGAEVGTPCTLENIAAMVAHPEGMFMRARGRRALWINQADDEASRAQARAFYRLLPEDFRRSLDGAGCGSLRDGIYEALREG